jgi:Sulfotransferase family
MRVLYITGWCRSGSTILGNLLGELPGVLHAGELSFLWRNGVLRSGTNDLCGCGTPLARCPLWAAVIRRVAGPEPAVLASGLAEGQRRYLRTRHACARLAEVAGRRPVPGGVTAMLDQMAATYRAIAAETGCALVVDSSKYPAEAAALLGRPDIDLRILHLVRDPRATAHSWRKAKAYIPAMRTASSTRYWLAANLTSDLIGRVAAGRYLRLRYEDFAAAPAASLTAVQRLAGVPGPPPVAGDGTAVLGVNHTVTGNPVRLARGPVRIRPDDAWRRELPAAPALLATVLAAPALARYGYPLGR